MISLTTIGIFLTLPVKLLWVAIKYPFVGGVNNKFKSDLASSLKLTIFRSALGFPIRDKGTLSVISNDTVINSVIRKQYPNLTSSLNNYGKRYDENSIWIVEAEGRAVTDPVIIFIHGGCFVFEACQEQIESLLSSYYLLEPRNREKVSILFIDYKLASKGCHVPQQLDQVVETYGRLVSEGNNNFITMGDSAGGNLAITFLQRLKTDESLCGFPVPRSTIMISPWTKLVPDSGDYEAPHSLHVNSMHDMMQARHYRQMFDTDEIDVMFGDNEYRSLTVSPGNCTYKTSDWEDIPTFHEPGYSTFVILGEDETMRDDILTWAKYALGSSLAPPLRGSNGVWDPEVHEYFRDEKDSAFVEVVMEPQGIHDAFFIFENGILGELEKGKKVSVEELDKVKYFGTIRVVEFLNRVLLESESKKTV
ncbi:putative steryl acetyl hydrolase mug81 [Candida viswanathii]|uniref:Putative steryl acetyl hydrolase mug81 n=1 Tax=Candida viswanathii TaxID=5486 RepID=A0A367YJ40_9ASCO|nr:putative steryl acetyl hydrolase mug81 [Candida viswanathii]